MNEKTAAISDRSRPPLAFRAVAIRLGLAFTFLVALLMAVGNLGIRRMDRIDADLQDILGEGSAKLRLSREALSYSDRNSRITMQIFLLKDVKKMDSLIALREQNSKRISALIIDIESLCNSQEEKRLFSAMKDARGPYLES
jgi:hypothetical protein